MRRRLYSDFPSFRPFCDDSTAAMHAATRGFLDATRPHHDVTDRLDGTMIAAEVRAAQENIPAESLGELESYINMVLSAETAGAAKQVSKPSILGRLDKSRELADLQRAARQSAARLLYLRALTPGTAVMSSRSLSRLKSQSWPGWDKFDLGIVLSAACSACAQTGQVTFRNLHEGTEYSFHCAGCGHYYRADVAESREKAALECACTLCTDRKNQLIDEIIGIVDSSMASMKSRYDEWRAALEGEVEEWPSALQMERDYKLDKHNVGKDIRGILSWRPADAPDFEKCVKKFLERHVGKPRAVLDKALRIHVLYERQGLDVADLENAADLMAEAGKDTPYDLRGERLRAFGSLGKEEAAHVLEAFLGKKMDGSNLLVDAGGIKLRQQRQTDRFSGLTTVPLLNLGSGRDGLLDGEIRPDWCTDRILNPYFTGKAKPPEIQAEQIATNAPPLFNSRTEGQAYLRIAGENPECIVVPNRLLRRIADLDQLKSALEKPEFDYAKGAEIDFAVYDAAGRLVFVEELQRGDHHNRDEWIWKDAVKRKVLHLSKIPLRESF